MLLAASLTAGTSPAMRFSAGGSGSVRQNRSTNARTVERVKRAADPAPRARGRGLVRDEPVAEGGDRAADGLHERIGSGGGVLAEGRAQALQVAHLPTWARASVTPSE